MFNILSIRLKIFPYFSQRKWWNAPRSACGLQKMDNIRFVSDPEGQVSESYGVYKQNENVSFR